MQLTLQQKLAKVQTEFKSKKSRFNSFGKYYFRSAEDILEAIKPFLLKYGVTVTVNETLLFSEPTHIISKTAAIHDKNSFRHQAQHVVTVELRQN